MRRVWSIRTLVIVATLGLQLSLIPPTQAVPDFFNDANFRVVWERTDLPVEILVDTRGYTWGPFTLEGSPSVEPYADAPGGQRVVQYFDKSRMEVNDPYADRSNLFFVTNGLLVREMVSGLLQLGDVFFEVRSPSLEAVAGDPATFNPNSPTYASFHNIASLNNNNPSRNRVGQQVRESINKAGVISTVFSPDPSVYYAYFDPNLKHNIPDVMLDFLNQTGPVVVNGWLVEDQVIDPVFLAGLPITEAYWVKALVGGLEEDVLVQLYERRVLTYTPSNPPGFQVEMGNVGQHYLRWRYGGGPVAERIVFESDRTGTFQIYTMNPDGSDVRQLTSAGGNYEPRWSPENQRIVFVSRRDGNAEIYVMNADGSAQSRITFTPDNEDFPDWDAYGTRIFFQRETDTGSSDIWSMLADGSDQRRLTYTTGVANIFPRSSPNGQRVAFGTNRDGQFEVYTMNVDGSYLVRLTFRANSDEIPTDWKDSKILFDSFISQVSDQIWSMDDNGADQIIISGNSDQEGAFSPDMQRIAFWRIFGAGSNIFIMNASGSNDQNITNQVYVQNSAPDWSN